MPAQVFRALGHLLNGSICPTARKKKGSLLIKQRNRMQVFARETGHECHSLETYEWDLSSKKYDPKDPQIVELPVRKIRRPLQGSRSNDQAKVDALKDSIEQVGLLEPIDVLLVNGEYYGFSGCHRYQAHQELGKETIICRVRKATEQTLKFHMM